jgi:hypothetical protein
MATYKNPRQLVRAIDKIPRQVDNVTRSIAANNSRIAKANAEKQIRRDTNAQSTVTNAGRLVAGVNGRRRPAGAKLSVYRKPFKGATQQNARYWVWAGGPWQLIENKAAPHLISPAGLKKLAIEGPFLRKERRNARNKDRELMPGIRKPTPRAGRNTEAGQKGRAKALKTPYGYKHSVYAPKRAGKKSWARALDKTQREIANPSMRLLREALVRAL